MVLSKVYSTLPVRSFRCCPPTPFRPEANSSPLPELSLETFTATNQWLLLGFIPMAWTFVCPTEIIAFSDALAQFAARGCSVVFASTDSEYSLLAWSNASKKDGGLGNVKLPLLSDKNHQLSRRYGVLIEEEGIALRGLFLIDPTGIVRQVGTDGFGRELNGQCVLIVAGFRSRSTTFPLAAAWMKPCACSTRSNSRMNTERSVRQTGTRVRRRSRRRRRERQRIWRGNMEAMGVPRMASRTQNH